MAIVEKISCEAYFSPTSRRRYFTRRAAEIAEIRAIIKRKYPTEKPEYDENGFMTYSGWHWSAQPRLVKLFDRLVKRRTN